MDHKKVLSTVPVIAMLTVTLTVASPSRTAKADDEPTKITVDMDEYNFTVEGQAAGAPITLKTGTLYDLTVKNTGKFAHEIWFGKDPQMVEDENRLDGYKTNFLANVPMAIKGGEADTLTGYEIDISGLTEIEEGPGMSYTVEFTLPDSLKGKYEIGCFQPMPKPAGAATPAANATEPPIVVHYMVGMKADVIVQ